ncbi:hypothetical protein OCOJLMKI_1971 [Methylobacterium iners]|uniref:Esterase n=2 Tax=Methylobacterium iners TaxID=418707 RepID=A0ABQ4RYX2_9HYPH|nr:hypothetical protein OCOJLMKI_1971 [Methylobacterium iners]
MLAWGLRLCLLSRASQCTNQVMRLLATCALTGCVVSAAHAAETVQATSPRANPGHLRMYKYVPDSLPAGAPLVVALHGCKQSAESFDDESGWTASADALQFALLLPEQQEANHRDRCFRFFSSGHNRRDRGEAASIRAMIEEMKASHGIDPGRIFVTGLSAGGGMTAVMLAAYPEVFQAGAIIAGLPYGCASTSGSIALAWQRYWTDLWYGEGAWATVRCGITPDGFPGRLTVASRTPEEWRERLAEAGGRRPAVWPRVSLWQGDQDGRVDPANLAELMKQWTAAHGVDQTSDEESLLGSPPTHRHRTYQDAQGRVRVETNEVAGLGHALPVSPGSGCGRLGRSFEDVGVCAATSIASSWGLSR